MGYKDFEITIIIKGENIFQRLIAKLVDFTPVFGEIIKRWTAHNKDKFEASRGRETTGVSFDGGAVNWMPLSPWYRAEKQAEGFPDWLMVRTGELMEGMTNRGGPGWFESLSAQSAVFGVVSEKILNNWDLRPVTFLDEVDRAMIPDVVVRYLEGNPPFMDSEMKEGRSRKLTAVGGFA